MSAAEELLSKMLTQGAAFRPASRSESARVQQMLMALGFVWVDGDPNICEHDTAVARGLHASSTRKIALVQEEEVRFTAYSSCKTLLAIEIKDIMGASTLPVMQAFRQVAERQREVEDKLDQVLVLLQGLADDKARNQPVLIRKNGGTPP